MKYHVIVIISYQDSKEVIGILQIRDEQENVVFQCDVLDLPDIFPKGTSTYNCTWDFMNDLQEPHFLINGVAGHTRVFFHELNTYLQTEACVGLANAIGEIGNDTEPDILNSKATVKAFEAILNKQPFPLTVNYSVPQQA